MICRDPIFRIAHRIYNVCHDIYYLRDLTYELNYVNNLLNIITDHYYIDEI